jgi:hypothetical protein
MKVKKNGSLNDENNSSEGDEADSQYDATNGSVSIFLLIFLSQY